MQWLRLYSEARTDNKLRVLTDAQHRVWFNLLCYAGDQPRRGQISGCNDFTLAVECANGDEELLRETLALLQKLRILVIDDGEDGWDTIRFLNWNERQYDKPSDQPEATAERKRRSRAGHAESGVSRDVTPGHALDTDTDTEQKQRQKQSRADTEQSAPAARVRAAYSAEFEEFWQRVMRKEPSKAKAYEAWQKAQKRTEATPEVIQAGLVRWLPAWEAIDDPTKIPHITTWLNQDRWTVEAPVVAARASPNGRMSEVDMAEIQRLKDEALALSTGKPRGEA